MYEKAPETLLVPKAKGLDPHGKILLSDLAVKNLHADQLNIISGGTSSKKVQGGHVRYLSMTQRYGKRKKWYPKVWVSFP